MRTDICNEQNNEVVPQVEHMGPGYDWDAAESLTRIRTNAPLAVRPNLSAFHLNPATRLTDIIDQGYIYTMGLLASEALSATLRGFVMQANEVYRAEVVYHGRSYPYVWIHMTEHVEDRINFARSLFVVRDPSGKEAVENIQSHKALRERCRELVNQIGPLHLEARRLTVEQHPVYDLFTIVTTQQHIFVSDRLADALRAGRFTGFELEPGRVAVAFEQP